MSRPRRSRETATPAVRTPARTSGAGRRKGDVFTRSFAERIGRKPRLNLLTAAERRVLAELLGARWLADSHDGSGSHATVSPAGTDPATALPRRRGRGRAST